MERGRPKPAPGVDLPNDGVARSGGGPLHPVRFLRLRRRKDHEIFRTGRRRDAKFRRAHTISCTPSKGSRRRYLCPRPASSDPQAAVHPPPQLRTAASTRRRHGALRRRRRGRTRLPRRRAGIRVRPSDEPELTQERRIGCRRGQLRREFAPSAVAGGRQVDDHGVCEREELRRRGPEHAVGRFHLGQPLQAVRAAVPGEEHHGAGAGEGRPHRVQIVARRAGSRVRVTLPRIPSAAVLGAAFRFAPPPLGTRAPVRLSRPDGEPRSVAAGARQAFDRRQPVLQERRARVGPRAAVARVAENLRPAAPARAAVATQAEEPCGRGRQRFKERPSRAVGAARREHRRTRSKGIIARGGKRLAPSPPDPKPPPSHN